MTEADVSVVIPTYNAASFLAEAVDSVLSQTVSAREIIVVDDGSSDGTDTVARGLRDKIRYVRQDNRGPSVARNRGILASTGRYVAFLDSDDIWVASKIATQYRIMEANLALGITFGTIEEFDTRSATRRPLKTDRPSIELSRLDPIPAAFERLLIRNVVPTNTVMIRRECFAATGLFDATLRSAEDMDLWLRAAAHCAMGFIPAVLAMRRRHPANLSSNSELASAGLVRVLEKNRVLYPLLASRKSWRSVLAPAYFELSYSALMAGANRDAAACALRSLRHTPNLRAIRVLIRSLLHLSPSSSPARWTSSAPSDRISAINVHPGGTD